MGYWAIICVAVFPIVLVGALTVWVHFGPESFLRFLGWSEEFEMKVKKGLGMK